MSRSHRIAFSACLLTSMVPLAATAATLSGSVDVSAFNDNYGTELDYAGSTFTPSASLDYQTSFQGLNSQGLSQTMNIHATGTAEAAYGMLKASSVLTMGTPFYNAANPIYVDPNFNTDPNGVPDGIEVYSQAAFKDSLSVSSTGPISTLKIFVTLDGTTTYSAGLPTGIFSSPAYTQASIAVTGPGGQYCSSCGRGDIQGPGTFNQAFELSVPVSDQNAVEFGLVLYMLNDFNLKSYWGYSESADYSVSMDFSHTLKIAGLEGLDSAGNTIVLNSVTGASGYLYPVVSVPEPSQAMQLLGGLLVLAAARMKHLKILI